MKSCPEQHPMTFDKHETLKAKGIAICLLLFHHLFYSADLLERGGIVLHWVSQHTVMTAALSARVCVWIFAFLSAYGLTKQYCQLGNEPSAEMKVHFIKKHYISLMKPYWFIWPIVMLLSFFIFQSPKVLFAGNPAYVLLSLLGLSDFFGTPTPTTIWWYMCFAQILLVLIPFFAELCKKYGILTLPSFFILIQYLNQDGSISSAVGSYIDYMFAVVLGVYFAQSGAMEKLAGRIRSRRYIYILSACLLLIGCCICLSIPLHISSANDPWRIKKLFMSAAAVIICILSFQYVTCSRLESILRFLGTHSGNIFLTHSFFYVYYTKFIFWSHNLIITWATLLGISLLLSVLLEAVKSCMRHHTYLRKLV